MVKKILLVDDDQSILSVFKRSLDRMFTVIIADSGLRGLDVLQEQGPIAVVIADYRLPDMDGVQFLARARQIAPDTVRIMLTGYADLEGVISAINEGHVFRFLTKPCPVKILKGNIMAAVEQYKLIIAERELVNKALKSHHLEEPQKTVKEELARITDKLKSTFENTIQSMDLLIEKRDPYTANHQRRVAHLTVALARGIGFAKDQVEGLKLAATVHDIGKIYVPAEILNKPGKLSAIEFSFIKSHPQVGYEILQLINFPWPIEEIVLQHHERLNGSGYPKGLKGDEILSATKILSVADVVEAMTSHRPYKQASGLDKALDEISQNAGILYDEEVADVCVKLLQTKAFVF